MKSRFLWILGLIIIACARTPKDAQHLAERWVDRYYAQINPKEALAISKDEASDKLQKEIKLLQGVSPAEGPERPQTQFQVYPCKSISPEFSECRYEIKIKDIQNRIRHGKVFLRRVDGSWWVSNFIEEGYDDRK